MKKKLDEINNKYDALTGGRVYPYIKKNTIYYLRKGFYRKAKANYRGLSYRYDKNQQRFKVLLIGYFHVPENLIIIPQDYKITGEDRLKIVSMLNRGYRICIGYPSLHPFEIGPHTEEYEIAKGNYELYKKTQ